MSSIWTCPACGRTFKQPNQSHSCGRFDVATHLHGKPEALVMTFAAVAQAAQACGPMVIDPTKGAILFKRASAFASLRIHRRWVDLSFALPRPLDHPKVHKSRRLSSRRTAYQIRLASPEAVDMDVAGWLCEAYALHAPQP